jgi:leucyl-tRNA synthetase
MLVDEFSGLPVQEAKPKVCASMIEQGLAFAYAEPENLVISRSADECVVALMDQWYMDYGDTEWRGQAEMFVILFLFLFFFALPGVPLGCWRRWRRGQSRLRICSAWLNQWACARTYGLGSIALGSPVHGRKFERLDYLHDTLHCLAFVT